jgi:tRNA(Ile2) C34 agmatinyltransferase TiaS
VDEPWTDDDEPGEWQGERLRAHREALEVRRARQATATRVFAAALVATLFAGVALRLPESWWVPAIGGLAALALVFRLANWKCPSCGERLGGRGAGTRCPGCGAPTD